MDENTARTWVKVMQAHGLVESATALVGARYYVKGWVVGVTLSGGQTLILNQPTELQLVLAGLNAGGEESRGLGNDTDGN